VLEKLLQLVARGGVHSYEDLQAHLVISQPLLEMILHDLARLGYLREVGDGCRAQCNACPMAGCSVAGPARMWALTSKGAQAVTHLAP
jgi:hypothetical protein